MNDYKIKKLLLGGMNVFFAGLILSLSAYAWFFFPLTQNTSVYTDGVTEVRAAAYIYNHSERAFGGSIAPSGDPARIPLDFRNNNNEVVSPYFFLWGGEYTSNDQYQTLYKIVVTYGNEAGAYPTYLKLYGNFTFDFWCLGNEAETIDIRFMKLSYFIPTEATKNDYLNTAAYTAFTESDYESGCTLDLGMADGNATLSGTYAMTFYLLLETDLDALNEKAALLNNEYGLLDSGYSINVNLYCRTVPANTYS